MNILIAILVGLLLLVAAAALKLRSMSSKDKKKILKKGLPVLYQRIEDAGLVERLPGFVPDYHRMYPELETLEKNHHIIRHECEALLGRKNELTDMKKMGGDHTAGGIHVVQWKTFMFKSGDFVEANCALAPETANLLRGIPNLYTAFFSILEPHQYITPHWGYYKGFLRYHLGVIIPDENIDGKCWLRVNDEREANIARDKSRVSAGKTYHWRNGEGVVFDDTYLHDAANESDEVRVVLWLDMLKPHPWYLQGLNRLILWIAERDKSVRKFRENSLIG